MSDKTSKKRKRDDSEEEVQLEHKKKKSKTANNNNNNSDKEDEVTAVDVAATKEKKKSKKSKKNDKEDKDNSGSEKEARKKQTKEKTKKAATDPDQEKAASEDIDATKPKKKRTKAKKKDHKAPEPVEPAKVDDSESETDQDKKKKKGKKSKKNYTNAKTDSAEEMSDTDVESKRGRFSTAENELLETKILEYIAAQGWTKDDGLETICNGKLRERQGAWKEIASVVPKREWRAVASHCRRRFNPHNYRGSWTTEEEDELRQLYRQHGTSWRKIATELGRFKTSVRDKWRQIEEEDLRKGPWSAEEDAKLLEALKEVNGGSLPGADSPPILWSVVSKRVGTRHQNQCQARWRKVNPSQSNISNHEWTGDDYKKLLVKVNSMKPQDISEITVSQLSKKWTYKTVSTRLPMLLKHVPDYRNMKLPQILKELIAQYKLDADEVAKIKKDIIDEGW